MRDTGLALDVLMWNTDTQQSRRLLGLGHREVCADMLGAHGGCHSASRQGPTRTYTAPTVAILGGCPRRHLAGVMWPEICG